MGNLKQPNQQEDRILEFSRFSGHPKSVLTQDLVLPVTLTFGQRRSIVQIFSASERKVLKFLARGHSNRQIAEMLCLSVRTIETHRKNMIRKIEAKNTANLIYLAMSKGLLN